MNNDKFCNICDHHIEENERYYASNSTIMCEECADKLLYFCDELDAYVVADEYKESYNDDNISDIERYYPKVC